MGFFDSDTMSDDVAPSETDIAGAVPHDEQASEFFAENQVEEAPAEEQTYVEDTSLPQADPVEAAPEPQQEASTIPISELLVERRKRQEIEEQLGEQQHTLQLLNERIQHAQEMQEVERQQRFQQQQQQQQPQEEIPDPEEDPVGHANWKMDRMERQMRGMANHMMQQQKVADQQRQEQFAESAVKNVVSESQSLQDEFARSNPDYWDAFEHLQVTRSRELESMGYSGNELNNILENERGMIVNSCVDRDANGQMTGWKNNPAAVAYNLAEQRGYLSPQRRQEILNLQQQRQQQRQQRQQQAAPRQPVEVSARDRMNMVNQGMSTSTNLSNVGAPTHSGAVSLEQIVEMSDAQFNEFSAKNPGIVDALLGN